MCMKPLPSEARCRPSTKALEERPTLPVGLSCICAYIQSAGTTAERLGILQINQLELRKFSCTYDAAFLAQTALLNPPQGVSATRFIC